MLRYQLFYIIYMNYFLLFIFKNNISLVILIKHFTNLESLEILNCKSSNMRVTNIFYVLFLCDFF